MLVGLVVNDFKTNKTFLITCSEDMMTFQLGQFSLTHQVEKRLESKNQNEYQCNIIAEKMIEFVHKKNNLENALLLLYKNVTNIV